jgi:hypothetical protein
MSALEIRVPRWDDPCAHEQDRFVVDLLAEHGIPTVIVTSGGYTERSHALIARLALAPVERLNPN